MTDRRDELKQSLIVWRHILLPINNLIEWEHKYDPMIIFGTITFIFFIIFQINPSILTLISCLVLFVVLIDLLAPVGLQIIFRNDDWTMDQENKYTRLCQHIADVELYIKRHCESILTMRKERPMMYLMSGCILLVFLAFCGQRFNNLLLFYFIILIICLMPGIRSRQLFKTIHEHIIHFWNSKNSISSMNKND